MSNRFTQYILIAMGLGIVMGAAVFSYLPDSRAESYVEIWLPPSTAGGGRLSAKPGLLAVPDATLQPGPLAAF